MMKKELYLRLLLAIFAVMVSLPMFAYDFAVENADGVTIYYNWINGKTELEVTNAGYYGSGYSGNVVIPEFVKYGGQTYRVTSIGYYAFFGSGVTSVTIPNGVTMIGENAFKESSLGSITIPSSLRSIGELNLSGNLDIYISDLSSWCTVHFMYGDHFPSIHLFLNGKEIKDLVIPDGVTSISSSFYYCSGITSVTIPNSVTSISWGAFDGTAWYKNQPNGLVYAGKIAYKYKGEMPANTRISIKDGTLVINANAFEGCSGLISVTIPNSVTSIGSSAFSGCSGLSSITIPNSVTYIGSTALSGTAWYNNQPDGLVYAGKVAYKYKGEMPANTNISIKDGTLGISDYAFSQCSGLVSITIPNSVISISSNVFMGCSGLTSIKVESGNSNYDSRNDCNAIIETSSNMLLFGCMNSIIPNSVMTIGSSAFYGCSGLTSITIPNSVTTIGSSAFYGCSGLTSITIPNSVTTIGSSAFYGCSGLTSITIPNSVASIEYDTFKDCSGLTSITIPNSVTSIGGDAFLGCSSLTSITIPNSVTSIGGGAFCGCSGLTSITIPNSVTSIGGWAFQNCSSLISITIPNKVTSIGSQTFDGCSGLTSITIPNSLTSIGNYAFRGCGALTTITIPNSVAEIGYSAFEGCSGLISVTIPNSVTSISSNVLKGCSGLTSIIVESGNSNYDSRNDCNAIIETSSNTLLFGCKNTIIPNSVMTIGSDAFYGCSGLTSVTIPNSVMTIGSSAFFGCSGLTSLDIPNSVTSIGYSAFKGCSSLASITIPKSVTYIASNAFEGTAWYDNQPNGVVYADKIALNYKGEMPANTRISIKDGTLVINANAFEGCSGLISVTIPNSVTSIGSSAFLNCSGLASITIPNSVTSIGSSAFSNTGWYNNQPDGLVYAGKVAYKYKGKMPANTEISIKDGTLGITDYAFYECRDLISITIPNSVMSIGSNSFSWCSGLTSLIIPNSVMTIGSDAFSYCSGLTSVTIPNSVTSIGYCAFRECSGLTSVTIPNSVTSIDVSAFSWCSGLTSLTIPNSVTSIGRSAFYGCSGLTSVTIPNSVMTIGSYAFEGCSGLNSVTIPNSVTSIGDGAFSGCSSLTTITSEIEKPYEIESGNYNSVFSDDTYRVAELIVPYGTKAAYQATEGWNKFTMITEAANKDGVLFTIDGTTYEGSKSAKSVEVKSVDKSKTSLEIPAVVSSDGTTFTVTGVTDNVFDGCNMVALIWDVDVALPINAFSNASIGSNFLLYVKSSSFAPSSIKNVVVDGTASLIQLSDDGGQFYCPQAFTARSITYTHNYSMETGGNGKGWETIALPFDVQRIEHSTRGEIIPFAGYSSGSSQKPFWLASLSASGFKRASSIQAYEPYIIAMPNNSKYKNDYNLAGDVTFSADNVQVAKTPKFSGLFLPAFDKVPQSSTVYALNVTNRNVKYSGSYEPGSHFISNLRDVRPFEAYMTGSSSTRGVIEINFEDGTTDIDDILLFTDEGREITIHSLSGQQVSRTTQRDFDQLWNNLPKGVYIVNGKKMIK